MQFLVIGYDGDDEGALDRRMAAREAHMAVGGEAAARGEQIVAAALLDENERMRGSVLLVDFPSRKELDAWLEKEPYVKGDVWRRIEVIPCRVGPAFQHLLKTGTAK